MGVLPVHLGWCLNSGGSCHGWAWSSRGDPQGVAGGPTHPRHTLHTQTLSHQGQHCTHAQHSKHSVTQIKARCIHLKGHCDTLYIVLTQTGSFISHTQMNECMIKACIKHGSLPSSGVSLSADHHSTVTLLVIPHQS